VPDTSRNFKPGWKILEEAATAVIVRPTDEEAGKFFEIQLLARSEEIIPETEKGRIMSILVVVCHQLYGKQQFWPILLAGFFDSQVGRDGLMVLLEDHPTWRLTDHPESSLGYIVLNQDYRAPITVVDVQVASQLGIRGHIERGPAGLLVARG
jgi:hypothetical protein